MESASPVPAGSFLDALDGQRVLASWHDSLVASLLTLWTRCSPCDRAILAPFGAFLSRNAAEIQGFRLKLEAGRASKVDAPAGAYENHPVGVTLLAYRGGPQPPGLARLTAILVSSALESADAGGTRSSHIAALSSSIRGAFQDADPTLRLLVADVASIPDLVRLVDDRLRQGDNNPNLRFVSVWNRWLRDTLVRWMLADPDRLRSALRVPALVPDLEGPTVPVNLAHDEEGDGGLELPNIHVEETPANEAELPASARFGRAKAASLLRASQGNLFSPPESLVPDGLIHQLIRDASANVEIRRARPESAEPDLALMFATATLIREVDLADVVWGDTPRPDRLVVDPDSPIMWRPLRRPPNAVSPGQAAKDLLEPCVDDVPWPLPASVHANLRLLAGESGPANGTAVFPWRASCHTSPYRLRDVIARCAPALNVGYGRIRLALAAELSRLLGPEVAQLVLGDSFSASLGPSYYSATDQRVLCEHVAAIQKRWFGGEPLLPPLERAFLGSRLVLTSAAARLWPEGLRRAKAAAHRVATSGIKGWTEHRNHLAGALASVTGHRPGDELGRIDLDQVIPEYGLILLRDKQSDCLRANRIAATGRRWVSDLRLYLDRLVEIAAGDAPEARVARAILRSDLPLFSISDPNGEPILLTGSALRQTMPELLQSHPNFPRHRTNQYLQSIRLESELRHAQLGWVVSPAHAAADLTPYSAVEFAQQVGPVLDVMLLDEGWYPSSQRMTRWHWEGVPARPLKDWAAEARRHEAAHETAVKELKYQLRERGEAAMQSVAPRLASAVSEFFPQLRLDVSSRRLERSDGIVGRPPIQFLSSHHALLCERVRGGDAHPEDALQAVATRMLLYRIVRTARAERVIDGPLPYRPYLSVTSQPSPYLPGSGLAVRQSHELREQILNRAGQGKIRDEGSLATIAVMAYSPYRQFAAAAAAVDVAARAARPRQPGDVLRLPGIREQRPVPQVLGGLPALIVARRGLERTTARVPDEAAVGQWTKKALTLSFVLPDADAEAVQALGELLQAAGRVELAGPERLVMQERVSLASVDVERTIACDDAWPIRTRPAGDAQESPVPTEIFVGGGPAGAEPAARRGATEGYRVLTGLVNPDVSSSTDKRLSDGHHGWRGRLKRDLARLHEDVGANSNVGLLVGFTRHRLQYGGRKRKNLKQRTLHRDLTRFGGDLLAVAGPVKLVTQDTDALNALYLGVLLRKKLTARRQAFDALLLFQEYLQERHGVSDVPMHELASLAGTRVKQGEAGLLSINERRAAYEVLLGDLEEERTREDASPELVRCCELRAALFLILEGSGIRPGSAHGLTLGDLNFGGRDFVHVRRTGEYGEAKSETSVGFVRLRGELWQEHRGKVLQWVETEKERVGEAWSRAPLFAEAAGSRRRFGRAFLTRRIDALLKWASGERRARTYWLRKTWVTERHREAISSGSPLSRDVYAALQECGHAAIATALEHYIGDPAVPLSASLRIGGLSTRAGILALTALNGPKLDMAWLRNPEARRIAVVLERLGKQAVAAPPGITSLPPPLGRKGVLLPCDLDRHARARHGQSDHHDAQLQSGLTNGQVQRANAAAYALLRQRGMTPWHLLGNSTARAAPKPPRRLEGTQPLFALLDAAPDDELLRVVEAWATRPFTPRADGRRAVMVFADPTELRAGEHLFQRTRLDLRIRAENGVFVVEAPERTDRGKQMLAAFRWVMGLLWIYSRMAGEPPAKVTASATAE